MERPSPTDAADALRSLSADRAELGSRVTVPWMLLAAFGALAAWWVGAAAFTTPGAGYEAPGSSWLALGGALVVIYLIGRETGIRLRRIGPGAAWCIVAIVVACLALFSLSLGLVSFELAWAVVFPSIAAFVVTTVLARVACGSALARLSA